MTNPGDEPTSPGPASDLQFDRVEPAGTDSAGYPGSLHCAHCGRQLLGHYFEVAGTTTCDACRQQLETEHAKGAGVSGFLRALFAGGGAALVGSALWYAMIKLTEAEWGILAVVVGLMVGAAVRWGSRRRGGWVFQTLAVVLTYLGIVSAYVPLLLEQVDPDAIAAEAGSEADAAAMAAVPPGESAGTAPQDPTSSAADVPTDVGAASSPAVGDTAADATSPAFDPNAPLSASDVALGLLSLGFVVLAMPFLAGFENIIGILIIGFALYQAWKLNRREPLVVQGPLTIGFATSPAIPAIADAGQDRGFAGPPRTDA